jgi:hypothetical protein
MNIFVFLFLSIGAVAWANTMGIQDDVLNYPAPCDLSKPFFPGYPCSVTLGDQTLHITLTTPKGRDSMTYNPGFNLGWYRKQTNITAPDDQVLSPFSAMTVAFPGTVLRRQDVNVDQFSSTKLEVLEGFVWENLRFMGFPWCGLVGTARAHDDQKQVITLTPRPGYGPTKITVSGFLSEARVGMCDIGGDTDIMAVIILYPALVGVVGALTLCCVACPCFTRKNSFAMLDAGDRKAHTALQVATATSTFYATALMTYTPAWATVPFVFVPTAVICYKNERKVREAPDGQPATFVRGGHIFLWFFAWVTLSLATLNCIALNTIYVTMAQAYAVIFFSTLTVGLNFSSAIMTVPRRKAAEDREVSTAPLDV